jgi:2,3-bisphosphoglycerate-dependent phosphoglycerate mutase
MQDHSRAGEPASHTCRIHLVRHGQTVMNAQVRFRGRLDVPLNEVGRAEARDAGRALVGSGLVAVYTSPLGRAREVAEAIAVKTGVGAVREQSDLVNLDYGVWEGLTRAEAAAVDPDAWAHYVGDPEAAVCPEGESLAGAAERVVAALRAIARAHPGQSVAAVSHGVMLRLAVLRVEGPSENDWQFALPTGTAIVFDVDGDDIRLVSEFDRTKSDPRKTSDERAALGQRAG